MITRCDSCGLNASEEEIFGGYDLFRGFINKEGKTLALCNDGIACARRAMARDGVKLLPHPKNPPMASNTGTSHEA